GPDCSVACIDTSGTIDHSLHRHAGRPTLFPYTTLFRSTQWMPVAETLPAASARQQLCAVHRSAHKNAAQSAGHRAAPPPLPRRGDRKSTRLNSSHVKISYAVFCLKKKELQQLLVSQFIV